MTKIKMAPLRADLWRYTMKTPIYLACAMFAVCMGCASTPKLSDANEKSAANAATQSTADSSHSARIFVLGMSCPLCVTNIDKQLLRVPGVEKVSVNLGNGLVLARLSVENPPTQQQLTEAITKSGFTLSKIEMPESKGGRP